MTAVGCVTSARLYRRMCVLRALSLTYRCPANGPAQPIMTSIAMAVWIAGVSCLRGRNCPLEPKLTRLTSSFSGHPLNKLEVVTMQDRIDIDVRDV